MRRPGRGGVRVGRKRVVEVGDGGGVPRPRSLLGASSEVGRAGVRGGLRVPRGPSPAAAPAAAAALAAAAAGRLGGGRGGLLPPGPLELLLPAPVAPLEGRRVGLAEAHGRAQARGVDAGRRGRVGGRAEPEPADLVGEGKGVR